MNDPIQMAIRADFKDIGHALAWGRNYEAYQEAYEVHVFAKTPSTSYNAIMSTISWGIKEGFTVLSLDGKKVESVVPEPNGHLVKKFRFVKDWQRTLGGMRE